MKREMINVRTSTSQNNELSIRARGGKERRRLLGSTLPMPVEFTATVPRLAYILTPPTAPNIALQLAVLAHPHPRFGGSKNDAILRILARELGAKGWWTLRYDSRGAGESEGSCSFSYVDPHESVVHP